MMSVKGRRLCNAQEVFKSLHETKFTLLFMYKHPAILTPVVIDSSFTNVKKENPFQENTTIFNNYLAALRCSRLLGHCSCD